MRTSGGSVSNLLTDPFLHNNVACQLLNPFVQGHLLLYHNHNESISENGNRVDDETCVLNFLYP